MQDYGLVSIITPTWACASFISETIRSVMAQTYQNWELFIFLRIKINHSPRPHGLFARTYTGHR